VATRAEPLTEPCKCVVCAGECSFKVPKRWFQCRPCVLGYHIASCEGFVEQQFPKLQPECARCGYERPDHG